ncbi:MAG: CPBP family intramembrane metalloprotease [Caldilinea sp.]|nr:CPBP family intramembrane metalloprotease [Caldilinea sp.]MDW8442396.1 CPBP family intramembrane glutamic endopeptidase [Caldilineaceae bacterium]
MSLALQRHGVVSGVPAWLHLAGAYGPFLAAFIVTAQTAGQEGVRELMSRLMRWRIGLGWLAAAFSPVAVFGVVALVMRIISGTWQAAGGFGQVAELPELDWLTGWLVWILTFGLGEETGWRGFALLRLQARYSARNASLILGLLWAGWHAPAFFYNYELSLFSVPAFVVGIVAGAMVLTWLYNSTGGSVLATALWHGSYNAVVAGGEAMVSAIVTAAVILAFVLMLRRHGPKTLSSRPRHFLAD